MATNSIPLAANEEEFFFKSDACASDAFRVLSFKGLEGISELFNFDVQLVSTDKNAPLDEIVGKPALLTIVRPGGLASRFVHGLVIAVEQMAATGRHAHYRATVAPAIWQLSQRTNCRIFQNKDVKEIITAVMVDAKIAADQYSFAAVKGTYEPRAYCVQYRESDLAFVLRLAEEYGLHFFFKHSKTGHEMVFADSSEAHSPIEAPATILYHPPTAGVSTAESVNEFAFRLGSAPGKVRLRDFRFEKPDLDARAEAGAADSPLEIYDYLGEYLPEGAAGTRARIAFEKLRVAQRVGGGNSDCRRLAVGSLFTLDGYGGRDVKKEYLLTRVSHAGGQSQVLAEEAGGDGAYYQSSFECIPSDVPFQARGNRKLDAPGPQTALVVGPEGEEIYTDKHGRVKVRFHWDLSETPDEKRSCWIRVSHMMAGAGVGAMFLPRVGQEVIVEFLEGDIDQPIITGRVYNGRNRPPYDLPAEKTKSTILTSSSKGGGGFNELRFEDSKDHEQVFLHAQKDMDICVKHDSREWIGNDRHLIVKHDQVEQIEQDLHLDVKRDRIRQVGRDLSVTVKGKKNVDVAGALSLTVKGDAARAYKGKHSATVTGDVYIRGKNIVIEGGTGLCIKVGGAFITLDASGVTVTGPIVKINSGGAALSGSAGSANAPGVPIAALVADSGTGAPPPSKAESPAPAPAARTPSSPGRTPAPAQRPTPSRVVPVAPPPEKKAIVCVVPPPPVALVVPYPCDYYKKRISSFVERHDACGHTTPDYYDGYGFKYCTRFGKETYPLLSAKGKAWLDKVRFNLQRAIEKALAMSPDVELDSDTFRKMAFDSHPDAYWQAGMKELPLVDLYRVGVTPDTNEWKTWSTWKQAGIVAGKFITEPREILRLGKDAGDVAVDYVGDVIVQTTKDLHDVFRSLFR